MQGIKKTVTSFHKDYHEGDPENKIHEAIEAGDEEAVKQLLKHGVTLCTIPEHNCFMRAQRKWGWNFVRMLLKHDSNGVFVVNGNGEPLLMMYVDLNEFDIVQELLDFGANPSDYSADGKTVLLHALQHPKPNLKILQLLIERGADAEMATTLATNALFYAVDNVQCYTREMFKIFVESGVDPTIQDCNKCTIFSYATENYFQMMIDILNEKEEVSQPHDLGLLGIEPLPHALVRIDPHGTRVTAFQLEKIEALEYLLELPQFQLNDFQLHDTAYTPPQITFLKNWAKLIMLDVPKLFLSPPIKQVDLIYTGFINARHPAVSNCCFGDYCFSPIGLFMNNINTDDIQKYILNFLKVMLENGFELSTPNCISPLTLMFYKLTDKILSIDASGVAVDNGHKTLFKFLKDDDVLQEEVNCDLVTLTKFLIENGVHVGQSIVPFSNNIFDHFRRETFLPDAVYAVFESASYCCLRLMLPYFAFPPLTLLILFASNRTDVVNSTFPILCEGGPIPPGSKYLNAVRMNLERMNCHREINVVYRKFIEMHSTLPSLKHLCRCAVRSSFAEEASQPGKHLPELLSAVSPPGLRDYLMMLPPDRVDVFYCQDGELADMANKSVRKLNTTALDVLHRHASLFDMGDGFFPQHRNNNVRAQRMAE